MTESVRVRFAPSPTGKLHVGGARTALFNWAYARGRGGVFLLRVEDTDPERSRVEHEVEILEGLSWLGLDWDEGPDVGGPHAPYRQSERIERHRELADRLLSEGKAYRCFCASERLAALRTEQEARKVTPAYDRHCRTVAADESARRASAGEAHTVRFLVPDGETRFRDAVRKDVTFQNAEVDDWIMVRTDGKPTYNFVVVCDDADMGITDVLRGEEHLVNTPKQVLLYEALGLPVPRFGHLPLMLGKDGKKLSKRTGDTALTDYRDNGYPPEAVANFLCLQGWALDGETEVFSLATLVERFDVGDVGKAGSVFDPDKLLWLAGEYIRADTPERLAERCAPFVAAAGLATADELERRGAWFADVLRTEQERIRTYAELPDRIRYLFAADDAVEYDEKAEKNARKHEDVAALLRDYAEWLGARFDQGPDALRDGTKAWIAERSLKMPVLFQPLRCALTGLPGGADLFEIMALLGREASLARIEFGIRRLG